MYALYISFRNRYIMIHKQDCDYYVKREANRTKNGRWIKNFTFMDALNYASKTNYKDIRPCQKCCRRYTDQLDTLIKCVDDKPVTEHWSNLYPD